MGSGMVLHTTEFKVVGMRCNILCASPGEKLEFLCSYKGEFATKLLHGTVHWSVGLVSRDFESDVVVHSSALRT
jgi:hypothetical protein